jgi:two-component system sensor kinase
MAAKNQPMESALRLPLWRQFRFNLTLAFIVAALLPLAVVAVVTISRQIAETEAQITRQLESVVELKRNQIDLWLNEADIAFDFLFADGDFEPQLVTALIGDASEDALTTINQRLADLTTINPYFERYLVYDTESIVILASNPNDVSKIIRLQPYFEPSLREPFYVQAPFFDLATTGLTMIVTRQLRAADGTTAGVLAGQLNLDVLGAIMTERTGLGETGETYLVSRQNNYLLTPSLFESYELTRSYRSLAIDTVLTAQDGAGSYLNYQTPPREVIGVYRWVPTLEAGLIAEVNAAQALIGAREAQSNTLLLGGVTAILAVIGGLLYARRLASPITRLTHTANQFANGDLKVRAHIRGGNEIGVLATAFNGMAQSIGERQTQLTEFNQTLERRVIERTREMQQARDAALTAQRIAQENSRLKSEFLSTMSHELRTPLNAIEGFTSIMLNGMGITLEPRAEDMVKRISANSKRLLQLINDFLDLSRIESGRLEIIHVPIVPSEIAEKWRSQVSVLGEEKGIPLDIEIDPALPPVLLSDEDALSKIAINLLSNAFKFTHAGRVTLRLARAGADWAVIVRDTGIGIPAHAREYIFEEFRQVDGSSKRLYGGTGLGLALVQKLSRALGGSVALETEVGKGSTFSVILPLIVEMQAQKKEVIA